MFQAVGLQTQIWNNQIRSALLLAGFPLLLAILLFVFFGLAGPSYDYRDGMHYIYLYAENPHERSFWEYGLQGLRVYGHWTLVAAAIWFAIAYLFHGSMIRAATHARPLERREAPEIYNLLENLCISRGVTMPKLQIIDTPVLNAFASGIDKKSYSITLTSGIVKTLTPDELEAVLAHELTHIMNRDVRLLVISVIFVGIISFLCEAIYHMIARGGIRISNDRKGGAGLLIALLVLFVGYFFAIAIRMAISRSREYLADAGAVELTKNPDALIRALKKISGRSQMPDVPDEVRQMFIDNHSHGFLSEMFATHPPMEDRIAALVMMGGRDVPLAPDAPSARVADASPDAPAATPRGPWG
jgi:heat shock protein HtpX